MFFAAIILGLFAYGGYKRQQRQVATLAEGSMPHNVAPATAAGAEIAKDVPSGNVPNSPQLRPADSGTLVPPGDLQAAQANQPQGGQVFIRQAPASAQPVVTQMPQPREPTPEERRLLAAYEREQQAIAAPTTLREGFGSPASGSSQAAPGIRNNGDDAAQIASMVQGLVRQNGGGAQVTSDSVRGLLAQRSQSGEGDGESADQNQQNGKEAFLAKARAGQTDDYLKSTRMAPLSRYEIKAGWEIPAVLEQALNSDLPGEIKALVSSNVYDTASGKYLLIPQGSRLVGVYNSRIGYGQDGVQVIWDRVIYPDGSSLDLSGMIGQDAHGFSGFRDKVDRHYTRLIGFAVLTSLFAAASEISQNQNRSLLTYPSPAQVAGSAVGQQASDLGAQITRRNLNVQPTIKIGIGYRFNVRVNRDILFDAPYTPVSTNR
ncbi:MAG TPA: TrbI/VirB10 family protein [Bryobacteraceae bacterium]|nr:TrbI/VirB10 family protein [Bryobacteraceae bacterium]